MYITRINDDQWQTMDFLNVYILSGDYKLGSYIGQNNARQQFRNIFLKWPLPPSYLQNQSQDFRAVFYFVQYIDGVMTKRHKRHSQHFTGELRRYEAVERRKSKGDSTREKNKGRRNSRRHRNKSIRLLCQRWWRFSCLL
ncbi:hypothetical protein NQ317_018988 [Molorchus minor]|uniref:Uncharacterized protein n=1 Tax=Molorchus minor TaxID=1323400 RepID=A0ABQ9JMN8_9CUCU|nr:hypothetical protein NQ317_018988 [Molorchus minor]